MSRIVARFIHEDVGQDLIEYALLAGLVGIGIITAMGSLEGAISGLYTRVINRLNALVVN